MHFIIIGISQRMPQLENAFITRPNPTYAYELQVDGALSSDINVIAVSQRLNQYQLTCIDAPIGKRIYHVQTPNPFNA